MKRLPKSSNWIYWSLGILFFLGAIALFLWVLNFWNFNLSQKTTVWAEFGSYVGGVLSPLLAAAAFLGLWLTIQQQAKAVEKQKIDVDSENYFKYAVQNFERAYEAIVLPHDQVESDRLAWLTSARLLLAAQSSGNRIDGECEGLKQLYAGEEAYWRNEFYKLIKPTAPCGVGTNKEIFPCSLAKGSLGIEPRSIRVIYDFCLSGDPNVLLLGVHPYTDQEVVSMGIEKSAIKKHILAQRSHRPVAQQIRVQ